MARALNKRLMKTDVSFKWNNRSSITIENLGFGGALNKDSARILADYAEDYVPFKSGTLNYSKRISSYGDDAYITYAAVDAHGRSYSKFQYNLGKGNPEGAPDLREMPNGKIIEIHRYRGVHELATSRWVHWAWSVWQHRIINEINAARITHRKFNENDETR